MARLRSELTDAEDRRRRAEQRIDALEGENRAVRARLESAATPLDEGFGVRRRSCCASPSRRRRRSGPGP